MRRGLWSVAIAVALAALVEAGEAAEVVGRVVDADGRPLSEAVVFLDEPPAAPAPTGAPRTALMDQVQKQFVPHVLPVVVGTAVSFPNRDQIHHHVYSFSRTKTFELPLYKGEDAPPVLFDRVGAVKVGCNIHDWMSGIILVLPTAHFAMTDESGSFALTGLPPGKVSLVAWHERQKAAEVHLDATAADAPEPLSIAIDVAPPRARPAPLGGTRSYE